MSADLSPPVSRRSDYSPWNAFATIIIGALVPSAVMSIAAANLFTRNLYKEYPRRE